MGVAYKPGQTLTDDDLKIAIRDSLGTLIDPFYIRYSLFDVTTGVDVLIGAADRIPATAGVGLYYVDATIPLDANIGDWLVRWNFRETVAAPLVEVIQEFNVVKECVEVSPTGSLVGDEFVYRLRILLRDNNPDRNYRFRPPSHEKFLQAQTQVFGYIWEDYELYEYVLMALDYFNSAPPVTGSTLNDIPLRWRTSVLLGAAAFACMAITMNWIADEFSIDGKESITVKCFDVSEVTLTLSDLFDAVHQDLLQSVERSVKEEYARALCELGMPPLVEERSTGRLMEPTGYSIVKQAFESNALKVRAKAKGDDKVKWIPVSDVLRHSSFHKRMYRVHTDCSSVEVTEDHSLFDFVTGKEIKTIDLRPGDSIISLGRNGLFCGVRVRELEEVPPVEYTYDLSVPEAENFVLDSGILAHNSYSISGVSLDLEKSSKYESMKQNFEAEFEKSRDLVKRSIKIIKGLKQPRYGIGISSALGPYSKSGVQSRRNFISGFRGGWA